jgi:hypothetical protein
MRKWAQLACGIACLAVYFVGGSIAWADLTVKFIGVCGLGLIILLGLDAVQDLDARQKLIIAVPVPKSASLEVALVMLSRVDGVLYKYLMAHGGKKVGGDEKETLVRYSGRPIYNGQTGIFTVFDEALSPLKTQVRKVANWYQRLCSLNFCLSQETIR